MACICTDPTAQVSACYENMLPVRDFLLTITGEQDMSTLSQIVHAVHSINPTLDVNDLDALGAALVDAGEIFDL